MATINPFQGPANYAVDVQSPFESALGGFKLGAGMAEVQAAQQKRELELKALQQAQQRQVELADLFKNPNATSADYARVTSFLPEKQAEIVLKNFETQTKEKQQQTLRQGAQVYSAIKSGNLDVAEMQLKEQAAALRNSGNEQQAQAFDDVSNLIRLNPTGAQATIGLLVAALPGGKDFLDNADKALGTIRTEAKAPAELKKAIADADKAVSDATTAQAQATNAPEKAAADAQLATAQAQKAAITAKYAENVEIAGLNKTNWDIKNLQSQISDRAAKLNIDRQLMTATIADKLSSIQARLTDLPEGARKLINESATAAASSKQAATQSNDLANRIQSAEGGKGALTSATEWFAKSLGQQDAWTQIRNEYTRVRNSVAIKALPPGSATDADIQLALKGIPPENANATTLASFLRGTAKLQDIDSAINNAKTDWLSQNNGLLTRSKGTFIAGDYTAKPGETFNDFAQRIVGDVSAKYRSPEQIEEQRRQQLIGQIPGQATPAVAPRPAPSPASIESQADAILRGGK